MPRSALEVLPSTFLEQCFYSGCTRKACGPDRVEVSRAWRSFFGTASTGYVSAFQDDCGEGQSGDVGDAHGCDLQHDSLAFAWVFDVAGYRYAQTVAGCGSGLPNRADRGAAEVALDASAGLFAGSGLYERETMIRANDWQQLEIANRELVMCLERLRKVRASGNQNEIQRAETAYFQALQWVYDAAVGAVADYSRSAGDG